MRSLLFVPGDDPRKISKALSGDADALIFDLEDSVSPARKAAAREISATAISAARQAGTAKRIILRINALATGLADADLDAVMPARPDIIMLPKSATGADVQQLSVKLAVAEAQHGLPDGATKIIPIATETAGALFGLGTYRGVSQRLAGLTWGAEDLSADLGAVTNRDAAGQYTGPYRLARDLTLAGASHAEVMPIDTIYANFRDAAGFEAECRDAMRDGFTAKMAIHPAQVTVINQVFTPSPEAVARARKIVEAFAADPSAGVIGIDGEMIDRPHIRRAERLLARAKAAKL